MINDESWVENCEISEHIVSTQSKEEFAVHLFQPIGSIVVSAVPMHGSTTCNDSFVRIHHILYDFFYESVRVIENGGTSDSWGSSIMDGVLPTVEMIPLPMEPLLPRDGDNLERQLMWNVEMLEIINIAAPCTIELSYVFLEDGISSRIESGAIHQETFFKSALLGRLVRKESIILISTCFGYALFEVSDVEISTQTSKNGVFRLGFDDNISLRIKKPDFKSKEIFITPNSMISHQSLPGYEDKVDEIMATLCIHKRDVAPSAILIFGPSGVGKSRMCRCIATRFEEEGRIVSKISVQDLIFRAMTTTNLYEEYIVPSLQGCQLCVLDDLHLLEVGEDETVGDMEYAIVRNSIVALIDKKTEQCRILGISQVPSKLPVELTKINRLEKTFQLNSPTQEQREMIWMELLQQVEDDSKTIEKWTQALASSTAGCVAADLVKIYSDATTRASTNCSEDQGRHNRWASLRDAAHVCIPSQLSDLDVVKPRLGHGDDSWSDFAAYSQAKRHIMRNVVLPWRIFLRQMDQPEEMLQSWIQPPPGVLFHGPSGCGKTKAAGCLAASLNLPTIHVRAADILDKWLGGSEALLRSLFARARAASPCVLFLDEIDAIAINREEDDAKDLSSRILSTLLNEMDGVSSSIKTSMVLVVACTNRLKALDSALLRPGRLQEHFHLDLPNTQELVEILALRMKNIPIANDVTLLDIAQEVYERGGTGADIEGLCREACLLALQDSEIRNGMVVGMDHIYHAMREIKQEK